MKILSFFSGIGAFEKALSKLRVKYELVGFSEINKHAIKSYCAIHNVSEILNLGDIIKIDEKVLLKNNDLVAYSFPCQDISNNGKMRGLFNKDGTQTRSGLFFEALRIISATQPRVAIAENVKNLTSKKFSEQFKLVLDSLEEAGYNNYWQVLNAKDYGIPQNRERVFIVSIRKDIDAGTFKFPKGFPLELRLKDMLEDEVDEKYYISDRIAQISDLVVMVKEATKQGYAEAVEGDSINFEQPNSKTRRGRVGHGVAQTLTTSPQQGVVIRRENKLRIRKLTPKECFRLMGFDDSDFEKAEAVNSNTQLYKQAGNSICVPVVEHIIGALFDSGVLIKEENNNENEIN